MRGALGSGEGPTRSEGSGLGIGQGHPDHGQAVSQAEAQLMGPWEVCTEERVRGLSVLILGFPLSSERPSGYSSNFLGHWLGDVHSGIREGGTTMMREKRGD